ncbi:MAG TPA: OmpA family protein [Solirubrobacteraceae bacterium]|nr:OmpA family protein [Solirubrobacteraceae bacterium]
MASRRGRRGRAAAPENEERWLLTYADMITLLMALFMVLFSISSVNISKYQTLQQSLKSAFSGSILSGGRAILQSGSESTSAHTPATAEVPAIVPLTPNIPKPVDTSAQQIANAMLAQAAAQQEQESFVKLARELNAYARAHGFSNQVRAVIDERGLIVQVLTDKLLFASGQATLEPAGLPLLNEIAALLNVDHRHPITVEGYTDNQPIHTVLFPSNWELSTDRATTVVRYLIAHGVAARRLSAAGYADLHPIASNATAAGRARNRRVDIVLDRIYPDLAPAPAGG